MIIAILAGNVAVITTTVVTVVIASVNVMIVGVTAVIVAMIAIIIARVYYTSCVSKIITHFGNTVNFNTANRFLGKLSNI